MIRFDNGWQWFWLRTNTKMNMPGILVSNRGHPGFTLPAQSMGMVQSWWTAFLQILGATHNGHYDYFPKSGFVYLIDDDYWLLAFIYQLLANHCFWLWLMNYFPVSMMVDWLLSSVHMAATLMNDTSTKKNKQAEMLISTLESVYPKSPTWLISGDQSWFMINQSKPCDYSMERILPPYQV